MASTNISERVLLRPRNCLLAVALTSLFGACAVDLGGPSEGDQAAGGDPVVNAQLGLDSSNMIRPQLVEEAGALRVSLPIKGQNYTLDLKPEPVRTSGYRLFVEREEGILTSEQAPESTVLRGTIRGMEGSSVTASKMADGVHARIVLKSGEVYWTEPVDRVSREHAGEYVLYQDKDVTEVPMTCALDNHSHAEITDTEFLQSGEGFLAAETSLAIVELAVDADFEFFQAHGSVEGSIARMEAVIAAVNLQYEAQVGIRHVISASIVRATPDDPYTSTDAGTLLQDELRPQWLNNHGDIQRDLVHLFTGKQLDGSTIGIAFVGAVCGSFGFGLSESNFSSNFACATDLTAHELGHNWAANHCDCTGNTMNPFLTCANTFSETDTVPSITAHRDSRTCLDFGDGCPDDPNKIDPGACGCGVPDADRDLDGSADCIDGCPDDGGKTDAGQCGCGVPDVHSDGDGVADCNDECPNDGGKTQAGACGCGIPDTDRDGDGVADCNDECPEDPNATLAEECAPIQCGDGVCDPGETSCSCPADCGAPAASEGICTDGSDNDCDGLADCADADCAQDASCAPTCSPDGDSCNGADECCGGSCKGKRGNRTCGTAGNGSGSDVCRLDGDSCKRNDECCSRTCEGSGRNKTCSPAPAGALSSLQGSPDSEAGDTEVQPVLGGCSSSGGAGGAGALVLAALFLLRSRRREYAVRR